MLPTSDFTRVSCTLQDVNILVCTSLRLKAALTPPRVSAAHSLPEAREFTKEMLLFSSLCWHTLMSDNFNSESIAHDKNSYKIQRINTVILKHRKLFLAYVTMLI